MRRLPLLPLVRAYTEGGPAGIADLRKLPIPGARFRAISSATVSFLYEQFLDESPNDKIGESLTSFYNSIAQPPLHPQQIQSRIGILRHALGHLLRCPDPWPDKLQRCASPEGAYHVPGLGPTFWTSLLQSLGMNDLPAWTPDVVQGMIRLGLIESDDVHSPKQFYSTLMQGMTQIRQLASSMTTLHCEHFLTLVARMRGRNLWTSQDLPAESDVPTLLRQIRETTPLRQRLKERGAEIARAKQLLEAGLGQLQGEQISKALRIVDPMGHQRSPIAWDEQTDPLVLWIGRLWEADDPMEIVEQFFTCDPIPGAGLWLPTAVLNLRDAQKYWPWNERLRAGYSQLDDSFAWAGSVTDRYRLFNEGLAEITRLHAVHPLEVPDVLLELSQMDDGSEDDPGFDGFCSDTFRFLADLREHNTKPWMERQRQRYHFVLRGPLVELCQALADQYVEPVLCRQHGWKLETRARHGFALTSICKNDFGKSDPYCTVQWIIFSRRYGKGRRDGIQFFVRVDECRLSYGVRLVIQKRTERKRFQERLQQRAEAVYQVLEERGAFESCRLFEGENFDEGITPEGWVDLHDWSTGGELYLARSLSREDPLVQSDDLVGDIILTFDRLLPLYCFATEEETVAGISEMESEKTVARFEGAEFAHETFLSEDWLGHVLGLLELKQQLILQGAPGTGKTFIAQALARHLTRNNEDVIRLVQFHPSYSYEEFVEGIKVRTVAHEGRQEVTYPVEDGLLCTFAAQAESEPSQPHVLIIDEINRGNLPRIFGELLYLLEYRNQAITLPSSRRGFRLPRNLYVIGTMNSLDRSVMALDQALRRRFSFVEMTPDANVLRSWLQRYPPGEEEAFVDKVVGLFTRLNEKLKTDLGAHCQVGHSYFMQPALDESRLDTIWQHQIVPLLRDFALSTARSVEPWSLDDVLKEVHRSADAGQRRKSPSR